MNVYEKYRKIAEARQFFEEYRKLARLVDDLDIRFWKRFILRNDRRYASIDNDIAEEMLRKEYKSCVADLIAMRCEVESALETVTDDMTRNLMREHFVRDLSIEEIAKKWEIEEWRVGEMIQAGLLEAQRSNNLPK